MTFDRHWGSKRYERSGGLAMYAALFAGLLLLNGAGAVQSSQAPENTAVIQGQPAVADQMEEGQGLLDRRSFQEAIELFSNVLARIPDYGPALAQRALAYARTNRPVDATRDLDAAARAMPDSALLHIVRATIAEGRSDNPTAIAEYGSALALEPGNQDALRARAHIYQREANHEAALADAETYIAAWPDSVDGYILKADLLIGQRERARAAAEADRLMREFPDDDRFLAAAATIYDRLADRPHAIAAMDSVIARNPDVSFLRRNRAAFRRWDDFAGRRADLDAALRLDPGNADTVTGLALLDFKERKWRDVITRFSSILASEPRDFGVLAYRAMAYMNAGEQALAERDYRAAMAASEGADDFSLICGSLAREGFALEWALEACNRAVALDADDSTHRANRGLVELRLGRLDAALADYDRAVAADAREAPGYYGRALVHHRRGEQQAAAADRAEALAIDPGIAETYQSYGFTDF
jgi:tetratricopeptide (TPR) repeat protein